MTNVRAWTAALLFALFSILGTGVFTLAGPVPKPRKLPIPTVNLKKDRARLLFAPSGELYAVHREVRRNASSAIRVYVFDSVSGKLSRSARLPASRRSYLKNPRNAFPPPYRPVQFVLSPDERRLFYGENLRHLPSQNEGSERLPIIVIGTNPLQVEKAVDLSWLPDVPQIFSTDGQSVLVVSRDGTPEEPRMRRIRLDIHDLHKTLEDVHFPIPSLGALYRIFSENSWWFQSSWPDSRLTDWEEFHSMLEYDARPGEVTWKILPGTFVGDIIPLGDSVLALTSESSQGDAGRILRFERPGPTPVTAHMEPRCAFQAAVVSPDGLFGAAVCERRANSEWRFGALLSSQAIIFRTTDLQVIARIPMSRWTWWHALAVWHGGGQIRLAIHDNSKRIRLYHLAAE